ncbi:MAG: lipopolysaccharide kinase InaA family protein [Muribaculaceae bacterium]|nr:lipopolysaccharide kinase InaA family protein [Muribaculaceae bacterium]
MREVKNRYKTRIVVNPQYPGVGKLAELLALDGEPAGARVIYDGRNRLYVVDGGEGVGEVVVKDFHRPSFVNSLVYTNLRKSKARRSYENAMELRRLGFGTPEPYAYVEVSSGGRLLRSYYLCALLSADHRDMRYFDKQPHLPELLDALGHEMVRLHRAGVLVKDFSPGNVLYVRDAEGVYHFSHVDLNRMEFGVKSHSRLMGNFRAMPCTPDEVDMLAAAYAHASGDDVAAVTAEAHAQFDAFWRQVNRKRRLKKALKRLTSGRE